MADFLSCENYTSYLVDQAPHYADAIIYDIRPTDGEIGHFEVGTWEAFKGVTQYIDRFHSVYPDISKPWVRKEIGQNGLCEQACSIPTHEIGWGNSRTSFYQEQIAYRTPVICFDNEIPVSRAREHMAQIVSDVLKPATNVITSNWIRRRSADIAGKKWLANQAMTDFTFTWGTEVDGDVTHIFADGIPTSKITPQMLQSRVWPLQAVGYMGKQPYKDMPPLIELVTDMETCWELDKAIADTNVNGNWRFQNWGLANAYYKYAFQGQLGDYVIRVDPTPLRFHDAGLQLDGTRRFNIVPAYINTAATNGLMSIPNPEYPKALYQFSRIWHRRAVMVLVADMQPIHPEMPFAVRSLAGKWQFAMHDLGTGVNGCVIENFRRNRGFWYADFNFALKPQYVDFCELIFHMRERACVTESYVCNTDPGYPEQDFTSDLYNCDTEVQ